MIAAPEDSRQEKLDFLEKYWNALTTGDFESFAPLVDERCVVHYPGNHFLSGDYHGRAAIVELYTNLYKVGMQQGTFVGEFHDGVTSDDHAGALIKYTLQLGAGQELTGEAVGVFHIHNGQMTEYWLFERDQKMINDIFRISGKPTLAGAGKGALALSALRNPGAVIRTARRVVRHKRGVNKRML